MREPDCKWESGAGPQNVGEITEVHYVAQKSPD